MTAQSSPGTGTDVLTVDSAQQIDWTGRSDGLSVGGMPAGLDHVAGYGAGYPAGLESCFEQGSAPGTDDLDSDSADPPDKS